jgi:SSS family solute:Na+ symporter
MAILDLILPGLALVFGAAIAWLTRRQPGGADAFFLGGRRMSWWLIASSIVAATFSIRGNLNPAQRAAGPELIASVALLLCATRFLPFLLRAGVVSLPQYLNDRFGPRARRFATLLMVAVQLVMLLSACEAFFSLLHNWLAPSGWHLPLSTVSAGASLVMILIVLAGGFTACVWADLLMAAAMILGFGWTAVAGFGDLASTSTVPPMAPHGPMAGLSLFPQTGGWSDLLLWMWVPLLFSWGLNQSVAQRFLGALSLAQAQKGIFLGAFLRILILAAAFSTLPLLSPVAVGVSTLAFQLISLGLLLGTIMALAHATGTLIAYECAGASNHPDAASTRRLLIGRFAIVLLLAASPLLAPKLNAGCLTGTIAIAAPPILAVFLVGFFIRRAPRICGAVGLLAGSATSILLLVGLPQLTIGPRMGISFGLALAVMLGITGFRPLARAVHIPQSTSVDLKPWKGARIATALLLFFILAIGVALALFPV